MSTPAQVAPKFPDSIFRAYDIRGTVPEFLNAETAYWLGRAIGSQSLAQDEPNVSVGRDGRLSGPELVWRVLLPATLPSYVLALRAGLGLGWMFVVAAEFMGASEGLGFLLVDGQMTGQAQLILASILAFAVLGKLTDWLLHIATEPLLRWQDGFKPAG